MAFKEAAGKLESEERDALEGAIRAAVSGSGKAGGGGVKDSGRDAKPQISLRNF